MGHRYRRLIFNAYPAILAIGLGFAGILRGQRDPPDLGTLIIVPLNFLAAGVAYWIYPRLVPFQCLDCGTRGPFTERGRHVCPDVARRIVNASPARGRTPGPLVQGLIQLFLLAGLLIVVAAL